MIPRWRTCPETPSRSGSTGSPTRTSARSRAWWSSGSEANLMHTLQRMATALPTVAGLLAAGACKSLSVSDLNDPDRKRILTDAPSVETLAAGALNSWFNVTQSMNPGGALTTMADNYTASWNDYQMRLYSSEPRVAWQNDPAAAARVEVEAYWYAYYAALSSADAVHQCRGREDRQHDGCTPHRVLPPRELRGSSPGGVGQGGGLRGQRYQLGNAVRFRLPGRRLRDVLRRGAALGRRHHLDAHRYAHSSYARSRDPADSLARSERKSATQLSGQSARRRDVRPLREPLRGPLHRLPGDRQGGDRLRLQPNYHLPSGPRAISPEQHRPDPLRLHQRQRPDRRLLRVLSGGARRRERPDLGRGADQGECARPGRGGSADQQDAGDARRPAAGGGRGWCRRAARGAPVRAGRGAGRRQRGPLLQPAAR